MAQKYVENGNKEVRAKLGAEEGGTGNFEN